MPGEPGSGRDQLFGGNGNDRLFGEADDDFIDAGGGTSDLIDFGTSDGGTPNNFVPPAATPPPPLGPIDVDIPPAATLPDGPAEAGRWAGLHGSAWGLGLSGSRSRSIEPVIVADASGVYAAWADDRDGVFQIYVARHNGSGWEELALSSHGGGVSQTFSNSHLPTIAIDATGQPVVAWTEWNLAGSSSDIMAARYNPLANAGQGGWEALGNSLNVGGISNTGRRTAPSLSTPPADSPWPI